MNGFRPNRKSESKAASGLSCSGSRGGAQARKKIAGELQVTKCAAAIRRCFSCLPYKDLALAIPVLTVVNIRGTVNQSVNQSKK